MKIKSLNDKIILYVDNVNSFNTFIKTGSPSGTITIAAMTVVETHDLVMGVIFGEFSSKVNKSKAFNKYVSNFYRKKDEYGFTLSMLQMKTYVSFLGENLFEGPDISLTKKEKSYLSQLNEARNKVSHSNFLAQGAIAGFSTFEEVLTNLYSFIIDLFAKIGVEIDLPKINSEKRTWIE